MSLADCIRLNLDGSVFADAPEVAERRNILYVPRVFGGVDTRFGLFDETGRQLLGSALFHDFPSQIKSQSILTSAFDFTGRPEINHAIYGGAIGNHYGHFITECLNTLWYYVFYGNQDDFVVFHSDLTVKQIFAIPWMRDILTHAGLRPERILIPRAPTMFRSMTVPGQAFSEDCFVYRRYAESCMKLGTSLLAGEDLSPSAPIYLSRANLMSGTRKLTNESELINALSRYGVSTCVPETLSIKEQIALFTRGPVIGLMGSAWHTSIFAPEPCGVVLCADPKPRRSFPLMDAVHGSKIKYVYDLQQQEASALPNFSQPFALSDPEAIAAGLMEKLRSPDPQGCPQKLPTLPAEPVAVYTLMSHSGEPILVHTALERISACTESDAWQVPALLVTVGEIAFLCAGDPALPALQIAHETMYAPILSYNCGRNGNLVTLKHPATKKWLTAPPAETGLPLHCDATEARDWEHFHLVECDVSALGGRLSVFLSAVRSLTAGIGLEQGSTQAILSKAIDRISS